MKETNPSSSNVDYSLVLKLVITNVLEQKNLFLPLIQFSMVSKHLKKAISNSQTIIEFIKDGLVLGKIFTTALVYEIFNPKDERLTNGLLEELKRINLSIYQLKTQIAINTEEFNNNIENTIRISKQHILDIKSADDAAIVFYCFGMADLPVLIKAVEKNTKLFNRKKGFFNVLETLIKLIALVKYPGEKLEEELYEASEYRLISIKTFCSIFFSVLLPVVIKYEFDDIDGQIAWAALKYLSNRTEPLTYQYPEEVQSINKYLDFFESEYSLFRHNKCPKILKSIDHPLFKLINLRNYCVNRPESRTAKIATEVKAAIDIKNEEVRFKI